MADVGPRGDLYGGLYGDSPALAAWADGDLRVPHDYRSVYPHILKRWLNLPATPCEAYRDTRLQRLCSAPGTAGTSTKTAQWRRIRYNARLHGCKPCLGGGIGRRSGLKIRRGSPP